MNTVPIDQCSFIRCPECEGRGFIDYSNGEGCYDFCELCGGMREYLEIDYVEDGDEVIEDE